MRGRLTEVTHLERERGGGEGGRERGERGGREGVRGG